MRARGFTLIELIIVCAIIGILAAIAIPNFIKFHARSKRAEVRTNLRAAYTSERAFFAEKDTFTDSLLTLGFQPERGNRFAYVLGATPDWTARNTATLPALTATNNAVEVDVFRFPSAVAEAVPQVPGSVTTGATGTFLFSAAGNIDMDAALDSWSIASFTRAGAASSSPSTCRSGNNAAGEPCGDVDDL